MSREYEGFEYFESYQPEPENRELSEDELRSFMEAVIWPAADRAKGGVDFRALAEPGEDASLGLKDDDPLVGREPDSARAVHLDFMAYCESYGEDGVSYEAILNLRTLRPDFDDFLSDESKRRGAVWQTMEYVFDPDNRGFGIYTNLEFLTNNARYIKKIPQDAQSLIAHMPNTDFRITRQACLDAYNCLLVLGVPPGDMKYDEWSGSLAAEPSRPV